MQRIGYYCWAGPGTIRMINLKFFNPRIDNQSLMSSYDLDYLSKVKEKFGVTDFWATYSWGFSEETEKPDREFLLSKLDNFKKLGIKLHAYVQGPNVVYSEFPNIDWYCCDEKNRPITYYRGRRVVCFNNPGFQEYKVKQIEKMLNLGFDGIYMDNIQMGQMAVPTFSDELPFVFAGCNCKYCKKKFFEQAGENIPLDFEKDGNLTKQYLNFRVQSTTEFLTKISEIVHSKNNIEFGTNSFEPKYDTEIEYGTNLEDLNKIQDYFLFETHNLPRRDKNNSYIDQVTSNLTKPVFVVSYKKGIGYDKSFSQEDFDNISTEDKKYKFFECIKGSEYYTNGVWHNLDIDDYSKPHFNSSLDLRTENIKSGLKNKITRNKIVRKLLKRYYNPMYTKFMESYFWRRVMEWVYGVVV